MFTYIRKAQYHETDQMGVIHHANYVRWMEEARVAFMDEIGFSYRKMEESGVVSPVTALTVEYRRPVHFDDTVELRLRIAKYDHGVALELSYAFFDLTTSTLCASAVSRHCFLKNGRPVSLRRTLPALDTLLTGACEGNDAEP